MTSVDPLKVFVLLAVAGWALESVAILAGSVSNQRRARRRQRLQEELRTLGSLADLAAPMSPVVRRVSVGDFQALALVGLPRDVEAAVARGLRDRAGEGRLRRIAGARAVTAWTRIAALQVLVSARDRFAHALLDRALRSEDRRVAAVALRMLVRLDDQPAGEVLLRALRRGTYSRSRVAAAFERLTIPRGAMVASLLEAADPAVRAWGARLAGCLAQRELAAAVRPLVGDVDPVVRRAAVEALGRIGEPRDQDLLRPCLLDPSSIVRAHAVRALATYADAAAMDAVADRLTDREYIVRAAARDALSARGTVARAALIRTLVGHDRFAAENAAELLRHTGVAEQAARQVLLLTPNGDAEAPMGLPS